MATLKLEAKMHAEELDATHEERFKNKRAKGKVSVTKDQSQYEKENSGVSPEVKKRQEMKTNLLTFKTQHLFKNYPNKLYLKIIYHL